MIISIIFVFKKKTTYQYFILMNFLVCSIIIQSIFFVTNMTEKTDPQPDKEILSKIKEKIGFPWFVPLFDKFKNFIKKYININDKYLESDHWAFLLGVGVDKTQIYSVSLEFILTVLFIFI